MKDRIIQFLRSENKTSAQFAEEIGVQPSSISHIISGRNNPSLDFVMKLLAKYPSLSPDWLLFGNGDMMRDKSIEDLFESEAKGAVAEQKSDGDKQVISEKKLSGSLFDQEEGNPGLKRLTAIPGKAKRIVCFFDNNTFIEYFPGAE
jgi:transcriptional regulator with XRE-family HTH domain